MNKLTATLAALTFASLGACASARPARVLEIPSDAPTAPMAAAPAPAPAEAHPVDKPAPEPKTKHMTEADKCVATCLAERKAAGDEQASEFWCVQDCNGGNDR